MKNKTPIQQLMTELRDLHPEFFDVHSDKGRQFLNNFHKYIAIENDNLFEVFRAGFINGNLIETQYFNDNKEELTKAAFKSFEHYSTSTFNS
jgi:hemerythrin-like domain-containing protein